jgi:hypothetical protein
VHEAQRCRLDGIRAPFLTLLEVTASFLSWALPTLPLGSASTAATLVSPRATSSARDATTRPGTAVRSGEHDAS